MTKSANTPRTRIEPLSILGKVALVGAAAYAVRKLSSQRRAHEKLRWDDRLRDNVVLITGGSRGLGLALAFEFGLRGCRLALCARNAEELAEACRRLSTKNIEAVPFPADISRPTETDLLIDRVIEHFGRLDVLVNNAGEIQVGPFTSFSHHDFESAMNLMFWAPVNLSLAALKHMTPRRAGQIVNIASIGGRVSVPHLLPYSCAKFALVGFSSGLAAEVRSSGIHVLTVIPGLMRTGSYLNAKFAGKAKNEFAWFGVLGNLPGLTIPAHVAAQAIAKALEKRQHNCTISLPAKLLARAEALAPNATRIIMSYVNAILPDASVPTSNKSGKELNSKMNYVFHALTALGKRAALTFNE